MRFLVAFGASMLTAILLLFLLGPVSLVPAIAVYFAIANSGKK
jgi:hypothetical protein